MPRTIEVPIRDGGTFELRRLTVDELLTLQEREYVIQRARLLEDLEAAGASDEIRVRELATLQRNRDLGKDLVRSAYSPRGAREIIRHALGDGQRKFDDLDLDQTDTMWQLALDLLGVDWRALDKEQPEADPTATGSPETGIETLESSPP